MSNAAIIQRAYDAFAKGDVPAVLGIMDPSISWTEAAGFPLAGTYYGPQAVLEGVFMRLGTYWNDFALTVHEIVDGGETVVALGQYTGNAVGTGKPLRVDFAHVWKLRDSKVTRFVQHVDTLIVQQSLTA